jgi:hypothetical protein
MSTTVYAVSAIAKLRMVQEGLWDAVPVKEREQWSQRFYNNKAAVRVATKSDDEIRAFIEAFVERRKSGLTGSGRSGESAAEFIARTNTPSADVIVIDETDEDAELAALLAEDEDDEDDEVADLPE